MIAANDPGSTRLVYAMVIGLVVIGVALVLLGVWLVRQTRYDPPVLAPLERMGDGSWRKSDPATQRRILDEVRPEGAEPLAAGTAPPTVDRDFESHHRPVPEFDDLKPGLSSAPPEMPPPDPNAPVEEAASVEEASPVEDAVPVEDAAPVDDLVEDAAPVDDLVEDAAPVEEVDEVDDPVRVEDPIGDAAPGERSDDVADSADDAER